MANREVRALCGKDELTGQIEINDDRVTVWVENENSSLRYEQVFERMSFKAGFLAAKLERTPKREWTMEVSLVIYHWGFRVSDGLQGWKPNMARSEDLVKLVLTERAIKWLDQNL